MENLYTTRQSTAIIQERFHIKVTHKFIKVKICDPIAFSKVQTKVGV